MTVAMTSNLSEGVILGVDSALTVGGTKGTKVYDGTDKLFPVGTCPVGVATYGAGDFGGRLIGSYLREFEVGDPIHLPSDSA